MDRQEPRFEEHPSESEMPKSAADRAFQLLARWAVRRAKENRKVAQRSPNNGVTGDVSKG